MPLGVAPVRGAVVPRPARPIAGAIQQKKCTVLSASGPGGGVDNLLLETGDNLLLEDGSVLLLET